MVCVLAIHAYGALLEALDLVYGDPLRLMWGSSIAEDEDEDGAAVSRRSGMRKGGGAADVEIDGWTGLHLLFYGVLAFVFPRRWLLLFVLGVLWEAYEYAISRRSEWWYARWQDIVTNSVGILLGVALAMAFRRPSSSSSSSLVRPRRRRTRRTSSV